MFEKKRLIIVCTEATQKYGNYLIQLIESKDDYEEMPRGTKDGTIEAVLWLEKEYEANRQELSSTDKVLFVGDSKVMQGKRAFMQKTFSMHKMNFYSLGNQAALWLDNKALSKKEYAAFMEFAQGYTQNVENKGKMSKGNKTLAIAGSIFSFLIAGGAIGAALFNVAAHKRQQAQVTEQHYSFLILYSYLELLSSFIED